MTDANYANTGRDVGCGTPNVAATSNEVPSHVPDVFSWAMAWSFVALLRRYYRLFWVVFAVMIAILGVQYVASDQSYTATAIIGPPGPSPAGNMLASMSTGGFSSGLSAKLLGGLGSSSRDPYQEYLQLLPSTRLCQALIARKGFLQKIYSHQWDVAGKKWKEPGPIRSAEIIVLRLLGRPVATEPNVDQLMLYLGKHLSIGPLQAKTGLVKLLDNSPYSQVTFNYENPQEAERILDVVLYETDRLIREDDRRDVTARIAFLRSELSKGSLLVDDRTALISILSDQERLLAMIQSDKRYASALIVPPYASPIPTSPPRPSVVAFEVLLLSLVLWVGIVIIGTRNKWIEKHIAYFKQKKPAAGTSGRSGMNDPP